MIISRDCDSEVQAEGVIQKKPTDGRDVKSAASNSQIIRLNTSVSVVQTRRP